MKSLCRYLQGDPPTHRELMGETRKVAVWNSPRDVRASNASKAVLGADIAKAHKRWMIECCEGQKGLESDMFTEGNTALFHSRLKLQQYILILFFFGEQKHMSFHSPQRGTSCHWCCAQSLLIHCSDPSGTPPSLPWICLATRHHWQSNRPSAG